MKVIKHNTIEGFLHRTETWLLEREAENNLILGTCANLLTRPGRFEGGPFLLEAEDGGQVVAAALMAPQQDLLLTRSPAGVIERLARSLAELGAPVTAVDGPVPAAMTFARSWTAASGGSYWLGMKHRVFHCRRLRAPDYSPGRLRPAGDDDVALLARWRRQYREEVGHDNDEDHQLVVESRIAQGQLFVWDDGRPVTMAGCGDETPNGVRVFLVFTPPEFRQNGYATSCVAALTARLLASGKRSCFLCADLDNPVSNAIYQKIGYRVVCDRQIWFLDDE